MWAKNDYIPDDLINKRFTRPNICEILYTILSKVYDWNKNNDSFFYITVIVGFLQSFRAASIEMWARGSKVWGCCPPPLRFWLPSLKLRPSWNSPHVWPQLHTCKVSSPHLARLQCHRADKICPQTNRQTPGKNPFCVRSCCEMCPQELILP